MRSYSMTTMRNTLVQYYDSMEEKYTFSAEELRLIKLIAKAYKITDLPELTPADEKDPTSVKNYDALLAALEARLQIINEKNKKKYIETDTKHLNNLITLIKYHNINLKALQQPDLYPKESQKERKAQFQELYRTSKDWGEGLLASESDKNLRELLYFWDKRIKAANKKAEQLVIKKYKGKYVSDIQEGINKPFAKYKEDRVKGWITHAEFFNQVEISMGNVKIADNQRYNPEQPKPDVKAIVDEHRSRNITIAATSKKLFAGLVANEKAADKAAKYDSRDATARLQKRTQSKLQFFRDIQASMQGLKEADSELFKSDSQKMQEELDKDRKATNVIANRFIKR